MRRLLSRAATVGVLTAAALPAATSATALTPGSSSSSTGHCTCMSPKRPTCEVWWQTSAIFVGRVSRIRTVSEDTTDGTRVKRLVTMRVQERWRGLQGRREVVVATGAGGSDCGFQFEESGTYLVYANQSMETGRFETGICSRTALVEDAAVDLAYLRSLDTAEKIVSLYGMVYRERQSALADDFVPGTVLDPGGPVGAVKVTLTSGESEWTTTSDNEGWYEILRLEPGRYELALEGPHIDPEDRWRLRISVAPACIWRNIIVDPLPFDSSPPGR